MSPGSANDRFPRVAPLLFALVFAAWMLPGLIGRDPWKADEAYSFGLVLNMVQTGDLVVPTLGSDPFMEKPPVFYWTSAAFVKLLSPLVAPHEAARASCVLFLLLTLWCLARSSNELNGPGSGWLAGLLLLGCPSLMHTAHLLMTDNSLVAGCALALYGMVLGRRKVWLGGALSGTGAGIAFLSKGLIGPGFIGVTLALLPLMKSWRWRNYFLFGAAFSLAFLPWAVIWPWLLYQRSPTLFHDWFWTNNFGRFLGENTLGPRKSHFFFLTVLPGFAFPAVWLAVWTLWRERGTAFRDPNVQLPLLNALAMLLVLSSSSQGRSLYATPMLVPLALLGVRVFLNLGERSVTLLNRILLPALGVAILAGWLAWLAQFTGWPPVVLAHIHHQIPGFVPQVQVAALLAALVGTLGWVALAAVRDRNAGLLLLRWTGGLAVIYLLGMTLWLPVTNGNMTYRRDFEGLREALGPQPGVIASKGLGEPQRAVIHYYAGLKPLRVETRGAIDSDWMLIQGEDSPRRRPQPPDPAWQAVWNGRHHRELFCLYRRGGAATQNISPSASAPTY